MLALLHQSVTKNQMTKIFVVFEYHLQLQHELQQRYFGRLIYGSWSPSDVTKRAM